MWWLRIICVYCILHELSGSWLDNQIIASHLHVLVTITFYVYQSNPVWPTTGTAEAWERAWVVSTSEYLLSEHNYCYTWLVITTLYSWRPLPGHSPCAVPFPTPFSAVSGCPRQQTALKFTLKTSLNNQMWYEAVTVKYSSGTAIFSIFWHWCLRDGEEQGAAS